MLMNLLEDYGFYLLLIVVGAIFIYTYRQKSGGSKVFSGGNNLNQFTDDLTTKAEEEQLDPIIGRQDEIDRVIQILSRRTKNNPILTGSAGVGKTAVVEGLALRIVTGDVPSVLKNKKLLSLDLAKVMSGTKYRGELEERFKKIIDEAVNSNRQVVLFIDEIHSLMQTKGAEGSLNMVDMVKPHLARGDMQLIGATTTNEYDEYIAVDEALARRFMPVLIGEPTEAQTLQIIEGIKDKYEDYHQVKFTPEALSTIIELSEKYIKNRKFPDKAIDLIDESGARVNIESREAQDDSEVLMDEAGKRVRLKIDKANLKLSELGKKLEQFKIKMEKIEDEADKQKLNDQMLKITKEIIEIETEHQFEKYKDKWPEVKPEHIKEIVEEMIGHSI